MTGVRVCFVDTFVLRGTEGGARLEVLTLRRAPGGRCPGSWETVHGTIEPGETPLQASLRELREETGLTPWRVYNVSRVEMFYRHADDEVALIPVFAALVDAEVEPNLSPEHDRAEWLQPDAAMGRFAWPREQRAVQDIMRLLARGDAGPLEDVLRVC